jgi:hypothetical protein
MRWPLPRQITGGVVFFLTFRLQSGTDTIPTMNDTPETFAEFWNFYVLAHQQLATRIFHTIGTLGGWSLLAAAIVLRNSWYVLAAVVLPYAFAWFSHFFVEHNRPATFGHPWWSWLADQKMVAMVLAGKMSDEVKRCAGNKKQGAAI